MSHGSIIILVLLILVILYAILIISIQVNEIENGYTTCLLGTNDNTAGYQPFSYRPSINYANHCSYKYEDSLNRVEIWPYSVLLAGIVALASYPLVRYDNVALNMVAIFLIISLFSYVFMYFLVDMILKSREHIENKITPQNNSKKVHWNDDNDNDAYNMECNGITYVNLDM